MVIGILSWLFAQASKTNVNPTQVEELTEWLTEIPIIGKIIAIFSALAVVAASIAALTGNLDKIIGFVNKYRPKKRAITDEDAFKLRQQLIEIVLGQVVTRLEKSLHHKVRLDLRRREERQRVGRVDISPAEAPSQNVTLIHRLFRPFTTSSSPTTIEEDISTVSLLKREDIQGRLLILGEPGSGKTNELLASAKALLQNAKQDNDCPFPVIFELSEWDDNPAQTLENWLIEKLDEKYDVPHEVAKYWIQRNQLFLFLDGLDELRRVDPAGNTTPEEIGKKRQARQIRCIRSINAFLDKHPSTSIVVCCRRKEYEALEDQGEYLNRLNGAIYLQELDDSQIQDYLNSLNRRLLWNTLDNQPELLKLVRSPLFLLMLVVAYQGQEIRSMEELLDLYIEKQLNDLNNQEACPPRKSPSLEKTEHYLGWLATKLEQEGMTEFLIERLQPSWLETKHGQGLFRLICSFAYGLIFAFFSMLVLGLLGVLFSVSIGGLLIIELVVGLFGGLIGGIRGGLFTGLRDIKSVEKLSLSWRDFINAGLFMGLLGGSLMGLIYGLRDGLRDGLIVGIVCGLCFAFFSGLSNGLQVYESEIYDKKTPNQGIKKSIKTSSTHGLIGGLSGGLIVGPSVGLLGGLQGGLIDSVVAKLPGFMIIGMLCGLFAGSFFGLMNVVRHICLRFVLYKTGLTPWNYERFLEHAENHRFIQPVGGRYRFVHGLLRKRFAQRHLTRYRSYN